jgi:hypothetical protein
MSSDFYLRPFQRLKFSRKIKELTDATEILKEALSDVKGTVTGQISGGRGDLKTLLCRDLCDFVAEKKGYSFTVDNVFFNNSQITSFLKSYEDVDEIKAVAMRDEFGTLEGEMSMTSTRHLLVELEAVRIKKFDLFVINPDERGYGEVKPDIQISPAGFNYKTNEHLLVFSLPNIPELYKAKMPSNYKTPKAELFYSQYLLKKQQYIKDVQNYKVDKSKMLLDIVEQIYEELPLKFTKSYFKAFLVLKGFNVSEAERDTILEFVKMKKSGVLFKND